MGIDLSAIVCISISSSFTEGRGCYVGPRSSSVIDIEEKPRQSSVGLSAATHGENCRVGSGGRGT